MGLGCCIAHFFGVMGLGCCIAHFFGVMGLGAALAGISVRLLPDENIIHIKSLHGNHLCITEATKRLISP
jgi:hypothetical protein